jgi:hypothetical protein
MGQIMTLVMVIDPKTRDFRLMPTTKGIFTMVTSAVEVLQA